jgi:hypothetical protein
VVRARQKFGKYRVGRRIATGGFATVYSGYDTIAGLRVALKIPSAAIVTRDLLDGFRKEVRLTARLEHPHILPIKDAGFIDETFFIAYPLGDGTLADRLKHRLAPRTVVDFAEQMLAAVAHAHAQRVMHCDLKPENFILFAPATLRLADFGIAKVARRTLEASGSGTVGYLAPEQALGKPSFRSDVFSLGLILYRMFSGQLPAWPFDWPPPGYDRVQRSLHPDLIAFLRRALEVDHRKRFKNGDHMFAAFRRLRSRALRSRTSKPPKDRPRGTGRDWRTLRHRQFLKQYRALLEIRGHCHRCHGPVSELMQHCPWCGVKHRVTPAEHRFRARCPRCKRSTKTDWRYCPWCYGAAINPDAVPRYSDRRYTAQCPARDCRGELMPFMRYCPWCRRKVRRRWPLGDQRTRCGRCGWGLAGDFWDYCAWCGKRTTRRG